MVLEECDIDLNNCFLHDNEGEKPIHALLRTHYSYEAKLPMLQLLLQHGADARLPDRNGKLPINIHCSTVFIVDEGQSFAYEEIAALLG